MDKNELGYENNEINEEIHAVTNTETMVTQETMANQETVTTQETMTNQETVMTQDMVINQETVTTQETESTQETEPVSDISPESAAEAVENDGAFFNGTMANNTFVKNEASGVNETQTKKAKKAKKVKEKKQHGFIYKAVRGAACAVVLGAVAGASCYGAVYAGYINFPVKSSDTSQLTEEEISRIVREVNKANLSSATLTNVSTGSEGIIATVLDVSDIVSNVISSVVAISGTQTVTSDAFGFGFWGNFQQSYEANVSGSGIIIGANDTELLVVTNAHVVDDVNNLKVTFNDDTSVDAVIKGSRTESDLAVLAIKLGDISDSTMSAISIAKLGSSTDVEVGEAAIAIGNAAGYGISVTTGIVSAVDKSLTVEDVLYEHLIQTDAAINPGNSGGALFNAKGEVIGINSVKMTDTKVEGMGYAISIESVRDIIDDLSTQTTRVALDDDERGYLGVSGNSVTSDISQMYGWPVGVLVKSVSEGSAAEAAGIQVNDVITCFDGREVDSWETLVNLMRYYEVGEEIEISYSRLEGGSFTENTVTVVLTARPETESK